MLRYLSLPELNLRYTQLLRAQNTTILCRSPSYGPAPRPAPARSYFLPAQFRAHEANKSTSKAAHILIRQARAHGRRLWPACITFSWPAGAA